MENKNGNMIIIPRFTKEAWMKLGNFEDKESGETLFEKTQIPANLVDFIGPKAENCSDNQIFKIVTLNDRFVSWIKNRYKNKKVPMKELAKAACEYAEGVSDAQATKDLIESKMDVSRYMVAIPVIFTHFPKFLNAMETNYRIGQPELQELERLISKPYGKNANSVIPGVVLNASETAKIFMDEQEWIEQIMSIKDKNEYQILSSKQLYESPLEYFSVCYIPTIIEFKHNSAVMKMADIFDEIVNPILNTAENGTSKAITSIIAKSFDTESTILAGYPILAGDVESHAHKILSHFYSNLAEEINDAKNPKPVSKKMLS